VAVSEEVMVLVHTSSQPVPAHVWFAEQFVGDDQAPASLQVSTWASAHCVAAGLHATHFPERQTSVPPVHGPQVAPEVPHEDGVSDAQGTQLPVEPPLQHPEPHEFESQTQLPVPGSHSLLEGQVTDVHEDTLVPG
jgi:hypothetical protein